MGMVQGMILWGEIPEYVKAIAGSITAFITMWKLVLPGIQNMRKRWKKHMERRRLITDTMYLVQQQLTYNGGGSMKDILKRVEENQGIQMSELGSLRETVQGSIDHIRYTINLTEKKVIILDQFGLCEFANTAFQEHYGLQQQDLEGNNWVNCIDQAQRHQVTEYLQECVKNERKFSMTVDMIDSEGGKIPTKLVGNYSKHSGFYLTATAA